MIRDAFKLSVYFSDSVVDAGGRPASEAVMRCFATQGLAGAALLRGIEGFGLHRRIHAQRVPDVSTDLPLLAMAVDERDRVRAVLGDVDRGCRAGS